MPLPQNGVLVGVADGVAEAVGVAVTVDVRVLVAVGVFVRVGVLVGSGWPGWLSKRTAALTTLPAAQPLGFEPFVSMENPPAPRSKPLPARVPLYVMTTACPGVSVKPSVGSGAQMKDDAVTSVESLHSGGSPVAGRPKAITSRRFPPSQLLITCGAMQAGGMPPVPEVRGTRPAPPPGQSLGMRQTLTAPGPVPRVTLPALAISKPIDVMLFGRRTAERRTSLNGWSTCSGDSTPAMADATCPGVLPNTLQPPMPVAEPAIVVMRCVSEPFGIDGRARNT